MLPVERTILRPGMEIRIIMRRPPGQDSDFVEVEDENGRSINVGEWRESGDGLWELAIRIPHA